MIKNKKQAQLEEKFLNKNKCNNNIKRENSTRNLSIINRAFLVQQGQKQKVCSLLGQYKDLTLKNM